MICMFHFSCAYVYAHTLIYLHILNLYTVLFLHYFSLNQLETFCWIIQDYLILTLSNISVVEPRQMQHRSLLCLITADTSAQVTNRLNVSQFWWLSHKMDTDVEQLYLCCRATTKIYSSLLQWFYFLCLSLFAVVTVLLRYGDGAGNIVEKCSVFSLIRMR